ncbi:MAG: hypothetical protein EZS28_040149, partial [Streblomastix strix]
LTLQEYGKLTQNFKPPKQYQYIGNSVDETIEGYAAKLLKENDRSGRGHSDRRPFIQFLHHVLQVDPKLRLTPKQAMQHPFITRQPFNPNWIPPSATHQTQQSRLFLRQQNTFDGAKGSVSTPRDNDGSNSNNYDEEDDFIQMDNNININTNPSAQNARDNRISNAGTGSFDRINSSERINQTQTQRSKTGTNQSYGQINPLQTQQPYSQSLSQLQQQQQQQSDPSLLKGLDTDRLEKERENGVGIGRGRSRERQQSSSLSQQSQVHQSGSVERIDRQQIQISGSGSGISSNAGFATTRATTGQQSSLSGIQPLRQSPRQLQLNLNSVSTRNQQNQNQLNRGSSLTSRCLTS